MSDVQRGPLRRRGRFGFADATTASVLISACACTLVVVGFLVASERFLHWFWIPVLACGILIGIDAVDWFRGRVSTFDPVGMLGLIGCHFFFLAPLLHVYWGYWMAYVQPPADWRGWLGGMAILNLCGLWIYRVSRNAALGPAGNRRREVWRIHRTRFAIALGVALTASAVLQVLVYWRYGGLSGYIAASEAGLRAFMGMGWMFTISESFPILAMIGLAVYGRQSKLLRSWVVLLPLLGLFLVLQMLFGGLRGSRSNTVNALFWAVGILHFWIRPVSKRMIYAGLVVLLVFMYLYGLYKGAGLDAWKSLTSSEARTKLEEQTGRTLERAILTDLARSDVQAFLLYRLMRPQRDYEYALGRTYLATAAMLIPKSIWPERPPGKMKEGTEALYGRGSYVPGAFESFRVYGVAGEAMLNFGPLAAPLAFILLGIAVGRVRHWLLSWEPFDARTLMLPLLVNLCFVVLVGDSDNVLFQVVKSGSLPLLVILLGSSRQAIKPSCVEALRS